MDVTLVESQFLTGGEHPVTSSNSTATEMSPPRRNVTIHGVQTIVNKNNTHILRDQKSHCIPK